MVATEPYRKVNPVRRQVPAPRRIMTRDDAPARGTSSRMIVASIPAPASVMFLATVSVEVQLHVPAGTWTVSPSDAVATAAATAVCEQFATLMVAASTCHGAP